MKQALFFFFILENYFILEQNIYSQKWKNINVQFNE